MQKLFSLLITSLVLSLLPAAVLSAQDLSEEELDAKYGAELLRKGTPAPDFTLKDAAGVPVSLADFRGRTVVLVFWASWCPDCRAEIPDLKAMQVAVDPAKVSFVSVSFDREEQTWRDFIRENGLGGVQLFDPAGKADSKVGDDYRVKWIPSLYVIDPQGCVYLSTVIARKVAAALGVGKASGTGLPRELCLDEDCEQ